MELVTHKKLKGGRLMPWGKGTVVTGARGLVFLAGNTATTDDYEPFKKGGGAVGDAAAQWRAILTNIKSDLEELGTSLDHLIKLTFFVKGPFPAGGVLSSPNFRQDVLDEFFAQHCPTHCSDNNPPPSALPRSIGPSNANRNETSARKQRNFWRVSRSTTNRRLPDMAAFETASDLCEAARPAPAVTLATDA
jgi:enamine deaminase RidA (YjgF/YER057c/UK114 family)